MSTIVIDVKIKLIDEHTSSEETVVSVGFTDLSRAAGWPPMSRHMSNHHHWMNLRCWLMEGGRKNLHGTWAGN